MADQRTRKLQDLKRHRKRVRRFHMILTLFVFIVTLLLVRGIVHLLTKTAEVTLSGKNVEIFQGEELPAIEADVKIAEDQDAVLDKKTKYTAADFARELQEGNYYTLSCNADPAVEGSYKVKVTVDEEILDKIKKEWKRHIVFHVKNGNVKVKNPVGVWDGDKFQRYDGSYVTNDFVNSMGKTYYFGEDGDKLTGWNTIKNKTYYFNKDGAMAAGGWKKRGDDRYYLGNDGAALTGWQDIKKKTYYFERDGKMATGEVVVGLSTCKFDKKGQLVSKEDSKIDKDKPMVALTFDDGPGERTLEVLEQLEKYDSHATFFMLGQNVSSHSDAVKKMKEIGCEIGNHSYDHAQLTKLGVDGVKKEMEKTNNKIKDIIGSVASVMRPPYGAINDTVKENVGMPMILWNIDTLDWKTRNAGKTIESVMDSLEDGNIILLHDIHTESVDAALELIPRLNEEGYQLVTVSELAAAKDVKMKNGGKYTDFTRDE